MRPLLLALALSLPCAHAFDATSLPLGVTEVAPSRSSRCPVLIIPGINETGSTWTDIIPVLHRKVYYLNWRTGSRANVEEQYRKALESLPGELLVVAHSAAGVFLFGVIARNPSLASRLKCHIIAAPLGGYGIVQAASLYVFSPFISYFGGRIRFPASARNTTVYVTTLAGDETQKAFFGWDSRYPVIKDGGAVKLKNLSASCSHCGAVREAVEKIF